MAEALNALGDVGNETERDALAMQLFGKSAMDLNPLIKAGGEELNRLASEARESGAVMSNESVAGLDDFGDALDSLKLAISGTFGEALAKIIPSLTGFIDNLRGLPQWARENRTLLLILGIALGTLTVAIIAYNVAASWATITTGLLTAAGTAFGAVMAFIISPITLVVLAIGAVIAAGVLLARHWDEIVAKAKELFGKFKEIGGNIVKGIWEGISGAAKWISDKISGFFGGIVGGVKKLLGIHSPSAVFEDAIGRNMALGIGLGFSDQMDLVSQDMQRNLQSSIPTANVSLAGVGASGGGSTSRIEVGGTVRVEGVNDRGQTVAVAEYTIRQAVLDEVRAELRRGARER
jgi:hypothetical protein